MNHSERDICTKRITPAVVEAGWDIETQIREEVSFTAGRIIVRGKLVTRGKAKRADYILYYKPNIPIAVIEAKDNNHSVGDGMQQALGYAKTLDIPFVFSSNGDGFLFHDRTGQSDQTETQPPARRLPLPIQALGRISHVEEPRPGRGRHRPPGLLRRRQRQVAALLPAHRHQPTVEAIAKGQNRILLVMATGTGKTYTAFQIIWRLWKAGAQETHPLPRRPQRPRSTRPWSTTSAPSARPWPSSPPRPRPSNATTAPTVQLSTAVSKKDHRRIDTSYEIYLGLYQAITGPEERQKLYREFSPDFFDLDRHRRVPPRQRRRGFRLARDPRILRLRHPDRPHRHPEGDRVRLQHPLLRRADLQLLPQTRHPRRLPRPLQGRQGSPRSRHRRLPPAARAKPTVTATRSKTASTTRRTSTATWSSTNAPSGSPPGSASSSKKAATASRRPSSSATTPSTPSACARPWSTRTPTSLQQNSRYVMRITGDDAEGKRRARQLHRPGSQVPRSSSPPRGCSPPASMPRPAASSCSTARSAP